MSIEQIRTTLEDYIESEWDVAPVCYQNAPAIDSPEWVRVSVLHGGKYKHATCSRFSGVIIVNVFTAPNSTSQRSGQLIDLLDALLANQLIESLIHAQSPSYSTTGEKNGWYQENIQIPYFADFPRN